MIEMNRQKKVDRMKKNDLYIIAVGLILALLVYGGIELSKSLDSTEAKAVEVYIDGELEDSFALDEPATYEYVTVFGFNKIEIADGSARIIEANCPTQSCIHDGEIGHVNETVICLPHRFHIKIAGSGEEEIDAISQ